MKKSVLLISALMSGILSTNAHALSNTEYKIGIAQEFENLNPIIMNMAATTMMYRLAGRSLAILNTDGKWVTQLAKEIPTIENKKAKFVGEGDKKTIQATWELLENANWGDGKPVTCDDLAFTVLVGGHPNVSVAEKETYTQITKIEAVDGNQKKCLFTYDKPRWDFYKQSFSPIPKHLEEPIFTKYMNEKEGYEKNSNYVKNPTNPGLYTGPYVISEVKLGSHVAFTPNPKFYGKQPKIQKIIFKLITNTGTLEANLMSGTIDAISTLGMSLDQALAFEKKVKAENLPYEVLYKQSLTYEHIDLNLDNEFLKDAKVRKALVYGINRQELVKALFEGKQKSAEHFVAPIDPWYTNDAKKITVYEFSQRKAKKLLEEAGWVTKEDGYRYKGGKKLEFVLMTTAGNKARELVQSYLKEQWKQIGIDITIKNEPARVYFGETTSKRKFPAMALFAWVSSPENNPKSMFHSKNIPSEKNGWNGTNYTGWKNPRVDALTDLIDVEFDAKKRLGYIHEIMKFYTDEVPVLPLFYRSDIAVVPKTLKNYRLTGHLFYETNEVENWDLQSTIK